MRIPPLICEDKPYPNAIIPASGEGALANSSVGKPKISDIFILTAAPLVRQLLRVGFVLIVARALGPENFGTYALIFAMIELLAVASGAGYIDYLTRETARDEHAGWGLSFQLSWLRIAIAVPAAVAEIGILFLLGYPRLVLASTAAMALTIVPRALSEATQGVLRGVRRYDLYLIIELVGGLTLLGGGCFLLVLGGGLPVVVITEIAAAAVAAAVALALTLRLRMVKKVRLGWRKLVAKTLVFNIYPFTSNLYNRVDVILLSKLAGNYATGIYSIVYRVLGVSQLLPYGVLYSLLPSISRDQWSEAEKRRLERAMGLLLNLAFVVVLATLIFGGPVVRLLLGARYLDSIPVLDILIWATIPMYLNFALNLGLLATGRERAFVSTSSVCFAVNFIGNLILIPLFSWRAAAFMTIVTELILLAQNAFWIRRTVGRILIPLGAVRTTAAFLALVSVAWVVGRLVSAPVIGVACLLFFLIYLYRTGLISEFVAVWHTERSPSS